LTTDVLVRIEPGTKSQESGKALSSKFLVLGS
jgi:hypothetical protein